MCEPSVTQSSSSKRKWDSESEYYKGDYKKPTKKSKDNDNDDPKGSGLSGSGSVPGGEEQTSGTSYNFRESISEITILPIAVIADAWNEISMLIM